MADVNELHVLLVRFLILRRQRNQLRYNLLLQDIDYVRKRKRRFWIREIFLRRKQLGEYHTLVQEMKANDRESYFRYLRMSPERFDHLCNLVAPLITKENTSFRESIDAQERLTLTLRFLASGEDQQSLSFSYRIGKATVTKIIRETCDAIWTVLVGTYVTVPRTEEDWRNIANNFEATWNFPHCLGAIDGKHIAMECPVRSGSLYYNYKGFFSIVLLAVCDANYCFTVVDIGSYGSNSDSGILNNSSMKKGFEDGLFNTPSPAPLPGCEAPTLPYYLVGDEIFPLSTWLMRPYPGQLSEEQRIFNYRLSRARRVIENVFGIMSARWRIFRRPIKATVENVERITKAAIALHNYLRQTDNASYCPAGFIDSESSSGRVKPGEWRSLVQNDDGALKRIARPKGHRHKLSALNLRESLKNYFLTEEGLVSWQLEYVRRCGPVLEE